MWLDDILYVEETGRRASQNPPSRGGTLPEQFPPSRSSANYRIVMFGQPGSARWGWMLTGHHLAANFTVVDGMVAFTPLFVGANPHVVGTGPYAGWRVLGHETVRGFALARSLTAQQRQAEFSRAWWTMRFSRQGSEGPAEDHGRHPGLELKR